MEQSRRRRREEAAPRDVEPVWQKVNGQWVPTDPYTNQPIPVEPGNDESDVT